MRMERHERISRRSACGLIAGAAAGLSIGSIPATAHEAFKLKYIVGSSMYGNLPIRDVVTEVRKAGADVIDVWPKHHATHREQVAEMGLDAFRQLLDAHHVKWGMSSLYVQKQFSIEREVPILASFGGTLIVSMGGIRDTKAWLSKHQRIIDLAAEHKVRLCQENHGETPDEMRRFAEVTEKIKHVGIALAPLHLSQYTAEQMSKLIEALGPKLFHFYAWQHGLGHSQRDIQKAMQQMPGVGPLDFTPLLAAMKKIGYSGWTEVFMHPTPRGIPILPTAAQVTAAINKSRAYLDGCAKQIA